MLLQARLTVADLEHFLAELTPLRIEFSEEEGRERHLALDPPTSVTIVADAGVRIQTSAAIRWSLSVFTVPVRLPHVTVLLRPSIDRSETLERGGLVFHLEVEDMDVANLPSFVDKALMQKVNEELARNPLRWDFAKTLGHTFRLPPTVPPVEAIALHVEWGETKIEPEALVWTVSMTAGTVRAAAQSPGEARSDAGATAK